MWEGCFIFDFTSFITFGGCSTHSAYCVHKTGRKTATFTFIFYLPRKFRSRKFDVSKYMYVDVSKVYITGFGGDTSSDLNLWRVYEECEIF